MGKPIFFSFSIKQGDPVRLATAMRDIIAALEPLTDEEGRAVVRSIGEMYAAHGITKQLLEALEGIVTNHDAHSHVDESWWQAGRDALKESSRG